MSTSDRSAAWWLAAGAATSCLAYLLIRRYVLSGAGGFPLDDSWIHLQFARNLAAGEGLSYNAGELVTGSTAPLWTALVSVLFLLPVDPLMSTQLLGGLLHVAALPLVLRLAREMGLSPGGARLAAVFTLGTGWLVWSALSGLEIPLFVLLSVAGVLLHLRERRRGGTPRSLVVLAVAVLARPEGVLLLLLAVADRCLRFQRSEDGALALRRPPVGEVAWGLAAAALVLLPVLWFNWRVGGSVLPTTFLAKAAGSRSWLPHGGYLDAALGILFRAQPVPLLFAGAGVAWLAGRLGTERDRGLLPALWVIGMPFAYAMLNPTGPRVVVGNFGRYLFPLFPFLAIVGVAGLERIGRAMGPRLAAGRLRLPWRALLVVLILWPSLGSLVRGAGRYTQSVANVNDSDVRIAHWLADRLPPEAVLAVNDIGAIKFLLPENRVVDLAGIAHPEAGRYRRQSVREGRPAVEGELRFLRQHRPDYLVIFPSWFPGLMAPGTGFRSVHQVEIPDNITMGGDRLAVLSTPWTRFPLAAVPDLEE